MTGEEHPREAEFKEATTRLNEGLRSCRAMVASYRAMLGVGDEQTSTELCHFAGSSNDPANSYGSGLLEREQI